MSTSKDGVAGLPTGIFCPMCGAEILLPDQAWSRQFLTLIALRANNLGTQFDCPRCKCCFIYRKAIHDVSYKKSA